MSAWNPALSSANEAQVWPSKMAALTIKKAKRPLFIIGSLMNEIPDEIVKITLEIVKKMDIPVIATGGSNQALNKSNFQPDETMGVIEIINHLKNPQWKGMDGEGNYDLVCFIGVPYYLGSQGLSTLKNFAPYITTLTLCRFMHPNADASFPNLSYEEWVEWLSELEDAL